MENGVRPEDMFSLQMDDFLSPNGLFSTSMIVGGKGIQIRNTIPCTWMENLLVVQLFYLYIWPTLPKTNIVRENGWLEYDPFLLGPGLFSGAMFCSFQGGYLSNIASIGGCPF